MECPRIPENEEAITADWLHRALSVRGDPGIPPITSVEVDEIGTGIGMVGRILRCHLTYRDAGERAPGTIIIKLPSTDDNTRLTARQLQLYQREWDFYRTLAGSVPVRTPAMLYGDFDPVTHNFVLLLEDLGCLATIDQVEGARAEQALAAVLAAARLHGEFWDRVDRPPVSTVHFPMTPERYALVQALYQASLPRFFDLFEDQLTESMRRLAGSYGSHLAEHAAVLGGEPQTLIHGDFRLDNMFLDPSDTWSVALVDWQLSTVGSGLYDVAYFLSSSVTTEVRREIESAAIENYHRVIAERTGGAFTLDQCWRAYRHNMLTCFRVPVIAGAQLDFNNTRGKRLAETILQRTLAAIDDLGVGEFLPAG